MSRIKFVLTINPIIIHLLYILFILLSLAVHLLVWVTSKHLVAISNISLIYILFSFKNRIYLNEK
jgi:hypothetical protein